MVLKVLENSTWETAGKRVQIFLGQLKGNPQVDSKTMLTMELVETVYELPVNLHIRACTQEELAYNCKVIVKETFKIYNLKQI